MLSGEDIHAIVRDVVKGIDLSNLADDDDFYDAGIDSLDHSMILLAVEEKSGVKIPDEALETCSSVSGIVTYLKDNAK